MSLPLVLIRAYCLYIPVVSLFRQNMILGYVVQIPRSSSWENNRHVVVSQKISKSSSTLLWERVMPISVNLCWSRGVQSTHVHTNTLFLRTFEYYPNPPLPFRYCGQTVFCSSEFLFRSLWPYGAPRYLMFSFLWFMYDLCNNILSSSGLITPNDGIISEKWIGRDVKGSDRGLISGKTPAFSWSGREKYERRQDSRSWGRYLNPVPSECNDATHSILTSRFISRYCRQKFILEHPHFQSPSFTPMTVRSVDALSSPWASCYAPATSSYSLRVIPGFSCCYS
jgi:hypothetical protein